MIWLAIRLWAGKALGAAVGLVTRWPRECAIAALVCLSAWLWRGWSHERADYAAYRAAGVQAAKDQAIVNHEPARKSAAIAEKSNAEAPAYYRSVAAAADSHAVRLRNPRVTGPASVPKADQAVPSIHGPTLDAGQPSSDLVCRPAVEDRWLVGAAARAAEMHQESLDLITTGAAIKDDN